MFDAEHGRSVLDHLSTLAVLDQAAFERLCAVLERLEFPAGSPLAIPDARRDHDVKLIAELTLVLCARPANVWFRVLDSHQVHCEASERIAIATLSASSLTQRPTSSTWWHHEVMGDMRMARL